MPQSSKLAIILAVTLAACGGKDDEDTSAKDSGSGHDASGSHDASSSSDASGGGGGSSDAGGGGGSSDAGSGSSDAGSGASDASSGSDSGNKAITSIAGGSVSSLDGGVNAKGAALLVRTGSGALVSLQVSGLMPSKMYPAHVHDKPCDAGAGGHYLLDKSAEAGATNEIWPALSTDDAGQGRSFVDVKVAVRDDAVAVVVHDPDNMNAKMLCADLVAKSPYTTTGTMPKVLGGAADAGVPTITASASITRGADGSTAATISASNLKPMTDYMVHVHDQPCDFASGGGHYKFDYGIGDAQAANEIWLNFTSDASGAGMKTATISGHTARAEAQAIVIHAMDGARLACIDLK